MRFFIDSEFSEDGRTIEMISIALVAEGGKGHYYGVSSEFDEGKCNDFVKANVLPHLPRAEFRKPRAAIAKDILDFVAAMSPAGEASEFWADWGSYDWVLLCQLYGPMIALPAGWPMFCRDLQQLMSEMGLRPYMLPTQEGVEHDALADATALARKWEWIRDKMRADLMRDVRMPCECLRYRDFEFRAWWRLFPTCALHGKVLAALGVWPENVREDRLDALMEARKP